ncbi:radical SAM protein [Candidatus Dependentiae bacterium]|nr:radical SAM protein [Candidatus Dependentiae bacterium]
MNILIIDGYVDEPSCLGVPPYLSPYPRYIYGLLKNFKYNIDYKTIDSLRKDFQFIFNNKNISEEKKVSRNSHSKKSNDDLSGRHYDYIIIIGGLSVPGKYLSTHPMTFKEITFIISNFSNSKFILVGSLTRGWTIEGGKKPLPLDYSKFNLITSGNYLKQIFDFFQGKETPSNNISYNKELFACLGSEIVRHHHNYPNIICEIETYSGCLRQVKCSFCVEQFENFQSYRFPENIISEMSSLNNFGIVHFRLGNQPDIFGYGSTPENYKPNPYIIEKLFCGIRTSIPNISTLHTDNANPAIISSFPEESKQVIKSLVKYCTGGNVLALGCESFDINVIRENNLNSTPQQSYNAVKIINELGSDISENGMPRLLPGVNLLFGLGGESEDTWKINYDFMLKLFNDGLLLRRINIRQTIKFEGAFINQIVSKQNNKSKYIFEQYKKLIRENIDNEMLKKIAPLGRILKNLFAEKKDKYITYCRQFGSYPILTGCADEIITEKFHDMIIVNHGFRSITGLTYPININSIKYDSLKTISGVSKKIANDIIYNRPFQDIPSFFSIIPEHIRPVFETFKNYLSAK